jgi:hypothetical protein
MKDGLVKSDVWVQKRLNATEELERITASDALEVAV